MEGIEVKMGMKLLVLKRNRVLSLLTLFISVASFGQTDSTDILPVPLINSENAVYIYDSLLKTNILTYQYTDLGDLDGDGQLDSIAFLGNGGAHTYFHLEIRLSSTATWVAYPTFNIDMPYWNKNSSCHSYFQFAVCDFDHDGLVEIYLDIENPFGSIPEYLRDVGLTSEQLLVEFEKGELRVRDFE